MILLRLSLLALAGTLAAAIEVDKSVLVLTEDNFDEAIKTHNRILVEFYAPWCGHCKKLAPEYEKAAERLEKEKSPIKLAKVDATVHKTLAGKYDVKGFPTLKWIANGATKDYNGPREAEGIYQWVQKQSGPAVTVLTTVDEAITFTASANNVVVGFFKDVEGASAKEFSKASTSIGDVPFAIVGDIPAVRSHFKAKRDGILMLKASTQEKNVPFGGSFTAEEISKWAAVAAIPLISEFSKETSSTIFGTDVQTFFILLISRSHEAFERSLAALRVPANIHKGNMIFVYVDADKETSAKQLEYVGVKKEDTPKYLILQKEENAKYLSDNTVVDEQEVMDFVRSWRRGEVPRSLKKQDLPKDWDKSPVKVLVASNFDEVAKDKSKDAFVEFYAPWCGHCKKLAPVWDDLGKKFDGDDSVVIAKMDATANEIPGLEVKSFPTLKWFKRNTNEVVEYSGDRDLASLVKFVESNKLPKEDKKEEL